MHLAGNFSPEMKLTTSPCFREAGPFITLVLTWIIKIKCIIQVRSHVYNRVTAYGSDVELLLLTTFKDTKHATPTHYPYVTHSPRFRSLLSSTPIGNPSFVIQDGSILPTPLFFPLYHTVQSSNICSSLSDLFHLTWCPPLPSKLP